jgi:chromosome segregation protein
MLIALELAGFKSFADKTRFDFPDGITVIVGPNGSGKSNVVDAIKWVLGAQSAKALRGKDMVDVIFKGSSGSGRKPSNSAEATLIFDNTQKQLSIDATEVHVTRRVYRNGEGEYLINNQACRLKDIRDLFRGTGVGVDAYSLIEQGKVDRMLQASPKDRRVIFEEAAGISRFNAKKAEAQRRLQRVDQNLIRLKDIVDEVYTRLNTLKNQATKAQKYREMTSRLHAIRLQLGWTELCELNDKLEDAQRRLSHFQQEQVDKQGELVHSRQLAQQAELELHSVAEQCQTVEAILQDALQRIAVSQNQQQALRHRLRENAEERQRAEARLHNCRQRVEELEEQARELVAQVDEARRAFEGSKLLAEQASEKNSALREEITARTGQYEVMRQQLAQAVQESNAKNAEVAHQRRQLHDLTAQVERTREELLEHLTLEQHARTAADEAAHGLQELQRRAASVVQELATNRGELEKQQLLLTRQQEQAAMLNGRLEGAEERLEILQQLQEHLEGVDAGARHVLELRQSKTDPRFQSVHGLVAELLEVNANLAPLIDLALGNYANAVVVADNQLFQMARSGELSVPGRLSLLRLDRLPTRRFGEKVQIDGVRGVLGRADRMIKCRHALQPLFRYLLGTTWLVESLDVALELGHFRGAGLRFVTANCEVIEADGTLTLGGLMSSAGLVSRRSEIQTARGEIVDFQSRYRQTQVEIERLASQVAGLKPSVGELEREADELAQRVAQREAAARAARTRLGELEARHAQLRASNEQQLARQRELEPKIAALDAQVIILQQQIHEWERDSNAHQQALRELDAQLETTVEEQTAAKVELARAEQRLESVAAARAQYERNVVERRQAVEEAAGELMRLQQKAGDAELEILHLTSLLAEDHLVAEAEDVRLEGLATAAAELRERRSSAAKRLDSVSRALDKISQHTQTATGDLERAQESSQALLKRFEDDYQIDFAMLSAAELISDSELRKSLMNEAGRLRQDIASVGEINMAALAELDELQSRYDYLNAQYEDLQAAKESLLRIINKINNDSRRLFMETLEVIRQNFQKLYRKSFGGGNADIVLEDGADVLECGIDIVATPPGKTALSNSLLSGGEKALTAVALLLAIFQYRPSPFCVLDEVDAPFDEANIGRFVNVLTEFLDWTKFIIVTHSKKTMTASTTLYGVTMQESGVSKQVAVRFEDVNDKGEIISDRDKASQRRAA